MEKSIKNNPTFYIFIAFLVIFLFISTANTALLFILLYNPDITLLQYASSIGSFLGGTIGSIVGIIAIIIYYKALVAQRNTHRFYIFNSTFDKRMHNIENTLCNTESTENYNAQWAIDIFKKNQSPALFIENSRYISKDILGILKIIHDYKEIIQTKEYIELLITILPLSVQKNIIIQSTISNKIESQLIHYGVQFDKNTVDAIADDGFNPESVSTNLISAS